MRAPHRSGRAARPEQRRETAKRQAAELHYPQPHLSLVPEPDPEPPNRAETAPDGKPPKRRSRIKPALVLLLLMLLSLFAWWVVQETRSSSMQARFFANLASKVSYKVEPGPSNAIRFPSDSPYDERLGYANLPDYLAKLKARDYEIVVAGAAVAEGDRAGRHGPVRHLPRENQGRPGDLRLPQRAAVHRALSGAHLRQSSTPRRG